MAEEVKISSKRRADWVGKPDTERDLETKGGFKWMTEVQMEAIEWFWYPYIPKGKLTILGGDPGQGKSFITAAIAAYKSRGWPLPGEIDIETEPQTTLMLAGEDDPGDTVKPRLMGMQANLSRIAIYDNSIILDGPGLALLRKMMAETRATLFVIDPIVAFLGAKMDMNRSNEVRPIMRALSDIAHDFKAAGLIVRHMRKAPAGKEKGKAIYNGMGSIDFTAAVRSELQVEEGTTGDKYLNHVKANAGPKGKSIRYSISGEPAVFEWGHVIDIPVDFGRSKVVSRKMQGEAAARQWLFDQLKDAPDGILSNDIFLKAKVAGYSDTKITHIKKGLVLSVKSGGQWYWKLDPGAVSLFDPDPV